MLSSEEEKTEMCCCGTGPWPVSVLTTTVATIFGKSQKDPLTG